MGRTRNSVINMSAAFFCQGVSLAFSFAARTIFIRMLSAEYLGIDGLFSNILNMLSLAGIGLGSAVAYSLYRHAALDLTTEGRCRPGYIGFFQESL